MKKNKLQKVLEVLSPDVTSVDFKELDDEVEKLKHGLKEKIQIQTIQDVQTQLAKFKKKFDLSGLFTALKDLESSVDSKISEIKDSLSEENLNLGKVVRENQRNSEQQSIDAAANINNLSSTLNALNKEKDGQVKELKDKLEDLQKFIDSTEKTFTDIQVQIETARSESTRGVEAFMQTLEDVRLEFSSRLSSIHTGGNANRNIAIGGNPSVLSKYTDINIKAGSNVTLTYSNNDTTKYLDLTIASSGGGSSVAGTVRSINRVSTSQTMGNNTGTDYVYISTVGTQLTLPDAASNTNLYTVKNIAASSVLVSTTGGQTIDGDSNLILSTQYTSVDLVNSGNDNWSIT